MPSTTSLPGGAGEEASRSPRIEARALYPSMRTPNSQTEALNLFVRPQSSQFSEPPISPLEKNIYLRFGHDARL